MIQNSFDVDSYYFSIIYKSSSFRVLFKYCNMNEIIYKFYIFNEIRLFLIFDNRILKMRKNYSNHEVI